MLHWPLVVVRREGLGGSTVREEGNQPRNLSETGQVSLLQTHRKPRRLFSTVAQSHSSWKWQAVSAVNLVPRTGPLCSVQGIPVELNHLPKVPIPVFK